MSANDTPTVFTDEVLDKWEYALQNVWALKLDRNETEGLLLRLKAAERFIELGAMTQSVDPQELERAKQNWLKAAGKPEVS